MAQVEGNFRGPHRASFTVIKKPEDYFGVGSRNRVRVGSLAQIFGHIAFFETRKII